MERASREKMVEEAKKQMRLAGPLIAANMLLTFLQVISTVVVGHIGEEVLAGVAFGDLLRRRHGILNAGKHSVSPNISESWVWDVGWRPYAAKPLSKDYHLLGVQLQKAMLVLSVSCIPVAIMWCFADDILCQIRFLCRLRTLSPFDAERGSHCSVPCSGELGLVHKTGLGYKGAALASSISYWVNVLLLAFYIKLSPACKQTWSGFSKDAFHGLVVFLKLAVPSATMICFEYWAFEAAVILSGLLPNPKLVTSSMSIGLNTCSLIYTITFGLEAAISTRVSNELGAGNPGAARLAISVMAVIFTMEGLAVGLTLIFLRNIWGQAYSKDREVVAHVASIIPLISAVHLLDAFQCLFSGIVRGCGWQKICAIIDLDSFYIAGIPIAIAHLSSFISEERNHLHWWFRWLLLAMLTFRSDFNREKARVHGIAELQEGCSIAEE
ncbi:hypothetical protein HPP92_002628 [Vanilla planifolia]|uniref:Multidrug and toxic compound extrusion protein n=1 Tax=Vanilla planifolia TaxID=51239 RepID=A0A835VMX9_VANPL|nr:hypothetical protein HPP92_002628 [Vanilla planifolia]